MHAPALPAPPRRPLLPAERAEALVGELSLQHCTNLLWAFATLKCSTPSLLRTLIDGALKPRGHGTVLPWLGAGGGAGARPAPPRSALELPELASAQAPRLLRP